MTRHATGDDRQPVSHQPAHRRGVAHSPFAPGPVTLLLFLLYIDWMALWASPRVAAIDGGRLAAAHPRWAFTITILLIPLPLWGGRLAARTWRIARTPAARRERLANVAACWGRALRALVYFSVFVTALLLSSIVPSSAGHAEPWWLHHAADVVLLAQVGVWLSRTILRLRRAHVGAQLREALAEWLADRRATRGSHPA
jgi:hypothetical protein